jgi:hypothetical protein
MADKAKAMPETSRRKRLGDLTEVADDQNWRSYVANENACAERWNGDWGFLAGANDSK